MVAKTKIMRWPPWPPLPSRTFEVFVVIHRLEGLDLTRFDVEDDSGSRKRLVVEIKWKGQKTVRLRRSFARNFTEEGGRRGDGVVQWNEEFKRACRFSTCKEGLFLPWEVAFTVFTGLNHGSKDKASVLGTALLNIAEFITSNREEDVQIKVPLLILGNTVESTPSLLLSLRFAAKESSPERQSSVKPISCSPCPAESSSNEKARSSVKAGLRKMKTFKKCMSIRGTKMESRGDESSGGHNPNRNQDDESNYPFDSDSLEDEAEGESEESRDETLPYSSWVRGSYHLHMSPGDEYLIYYSHQRSDVGRFTAENSNESGGSEQSSGESSKKKMLYWRKRKLSFRSPKHKGEPLLKKDCQEGGGDDIDFDRRQLSSSDEYVSEWYRSEGSITVTKQLSDSEFGEDRFVVGSWESKEITSRDGSMNVKAEVFFASIDQRSERAAGESACTALVAVIANWLQTNKHVLPTKSEFDSLIRDGSSEWRTLCENEEYKRRFPDKHFDLETVLLAKICPVSTVPEKSLIGFFHPEESEEKEVETEETGFEFLHGVMSFDSIWGEISKQEPNNNGPVIYIVSWNDHFFVLLIDQDAYYIIDTLGERLYEGCNQAYILKFDKDAEIRRLPSKDKDSGNNNNAKSLQEENDGQDEVVCRGKESCQEYIKRFLAAIPTRELKADMKKGLVSSVHHRLQIEFHYTRQQFMDPVVGYLVKEEEEEVEEEAMVDNDVSAAESSSSVTA